MSAKRDVPEPTAHLLELVAEERGRQRAKWGRQSHTPTDWATILGEELGEACKEALGLAFEDPSSPELKGRWVEELVHTAAVAIAAAENAMYGSA